MFSNCMNCINRHINCHSDCELYLKDKKQYEDSKHNREVILLKESEYKNHHKNVILKAFKNKKR